MTECPLPISAAQDVSGDFFHFARKTGKAEEQKRSPEALLMGMWRQRPAGKRGGGRGRASGALLWDDGAGRH